MQNWCTELRHWQILDLNVNIILQCVNSWITMKFVNRFRFITISFPLILRSTSRTFCVNTNCWNVNIDISVDDRIVNFSIHKHTRFRVDCAVIFSKFATGKQIKKKKKKKSLELCSVFVCTLVTDYEHLELKIVIDVKVALEQHQRFVLLQCSHEIPVSYIIRMTVINVDYYYPLKLWLVLSRFRFRFSFCNDHNKINKQFDSFNGQSAHRLECSQFLKCANEIGIWSTLHFSNNNTLFIKWSNINTKMFSWKYSSETKSTEWIWHDAKFIGEFPQTKTKWNVAKDEKKKNAWKWT